jgi:hypothetical protein
MNVSKKHKPKGATMNANDTKKLAEAKAFSEQLGKVFEEMTKAVELVPASFNNQTQAKIGEYLIAAGLPLVELSTAIDGSIMLVETLDAVSNAPATVN